MLVQQRPPPQQRSDNLTLVLTRRFPAPFLQAHPSPVVASGGSVTLFCHTRYWYPVHTIYLLKEGNAEPPYLEHQVSRWRGEASFLLDSVNASHGGNYTSYYSASSQPLLWSLPSTSLRLQVTGVFDPPSLSAQPGPLVQSRDPVTLRCHSQKFSIFALIKGDTPQHSLHGQPSPDFPLGPVSGSHGGRYRCYGGHSLDTLWSEPSAPLDILVAGTEMGSSPELWALPESHVPAGEEAMLLCRSNYSADTFHLAQEGSATKPLHCLLPHPTTPSQANFTLWPTQDGTYRCYSSNSSAPHLLSLPSQPLLLQVSGLPIQDHTVENLIRTGLGVLVLVLLVVLLCEACQSEPRRQQGCGSVEMNSSSNWRQEHHYMYS